MTTEQARDEVSSLNLEVNSTEMRHISGVKEEQAEESGGETPKEGQRKDIILIF